MCLFYGHYDVQPVDPLNLWEAGPFDAMLRTRADGSKEIFGRGSADDKGQLMTFVEACRAYKSVHGKLPCKVTILFEGEEESGSPSLKPFLAANAAELKAEIALVCDTNMWDRRDARHSHFFARPDGGGNHHHRRLPRSALRLLRRRGGKPDPCPVVHLRGPA